MTVHLYTSLKKGRGFFNVISSLPPGSDIQIKPRPKNLEKPKIKGAKLAAESRETVEISGTTERGRALMTLIKEATAKSSDGVFISKMVGDGKTVEEKTGNEPPSLAEFDYKGYGIEKPEVD